MSNLMVIDKLNSVAYEGYSIVKFKYANVDYLAYYIVEDNMAKICVSRVSVGPDSKCLLVDIPSEEKNNIFDLIKKVVIELPSSYKEGTDLNRLLFDFCSNNSIFFMDVDQNYGEQNLFRSSFLAKCDLKFIEYACKFYQGALPLLKNIQNETNSYWKIPIGDSFSDEILYDKISDKTDAYGVENSDTFGVMTAKSSPVKVNTTSKSFESYSRENNPLPFLNTPKNSANYNVLSSEFNVSELNNQDINKGKINHDISPRLDVLDDNMLANKNAGFASNIYIIIGTVCLILAAVVVIVTVHIIKNL